MKKSKDVPEEVQEGQPEPENADRPEEKEEVDVKTYLEGLLKKARGATRPMGVLTTAVKNKALLAMADGLEKNIETLMAANDKDLEAFDQSDGQEATT